MGKQGIDWSSLWKKDEWMAVWLGFLIIVLIIAGIPVKAPSFRWTTDAEFRGHVDKALPLVEKLVKDAAQKGEKGVEEKAQALLGAISKGDRSAIGKAAKELEASAKDAKDSSIKKKASDLGKDVSGQAGRLPSKVFSWENIWQAIQIGIAYLVLSLIAIALMGERVGAYVPGFVIIFVFAWIAQFVAGNYTILEYGLEYPLWCLALGLFVSNVIGIPGWLKAAIKTEFFIKTGLVILGSGILFKEILEAGAYGLIQGVLVVSTVWYFTFWVAKKLKIDDEFAAILSSGVSICGVSAAIATAGAVKGDPKKLTYVTSIVLLCAIPMLVGQPFIARGVGMPDVVAGAWIGGTLDTSPSVVAAASLISESAMKTGVIVKMSQNVLIGVAAFVLAIIWTFKKTEGLPEGERPGLIEIWYRFPKFVLGFVAASIVFSFFLDPKLVSATKGILTSLRTWWFALAFTCIGLETQFKELAGLGGGRPALAFVIGQSMNIIWTLILAYLLFGGIIFPAPQL